MIGARVLGGGTGLLAIMIVALMVLAGGPSEQGAQPQAAQQPPGIVTPDSRPIPMPKNPVGVEIALGLKDEEPTPWGGSVAISEGRVISLEIVGGGPNAKAEGNRFTARSIRRMMMMQATIIAPKLRVTLDAPPSATVTVNTRQGEFMFALKDLTLGTAKKFLSDRA